MRTCNYNNTGKVRTFEDKLSGITGYNFTRNAYKELKGFKYTYTPCVYFLLHTDSNDIEHIYIGQSINGFSGIDNSSISDWTEGYLFNSYKCSWSKEILDYLEYYYIELFKSTSYIVTNPATIAKPPISINEDVDISNYIGGLNFLLLDYDVIHNKEELEEAKFIIKIKNKFDELIESGAVLLIDGKYITQEDIEFDDPSLLASFLCGKPTNGYEFFNIEVEDKMKGINDKLKPFVLGEQYDDRIASFHLDVCKYEYKYKEDLFNTRSDEGFFACGNNWESLAKVFLKEKMPELGDIIEFDSENGLFYAYSHDKKALREFAISFKEACDDDITITDLFSRAIHYLKQSEFQIYGI